MIISSVYLWQFFLTQDECMKQKTHPSICQYAKTNRLSLRLMKKKKRKKRKRPRYPYKPQSLATEFIKINTQADDIYSRTMFSKHQCHKNICRKYGKKT